MQRREKEKEVREGPKGEFLIAMSNKENEVIKFISDEQRILCEKIITLHLQRDEQLILHYETQLQTIRDYLQRLKGLPSTISTHQEMQVYRTFSQSKLVLKIVSRFWEYPTFQDFLRKQAIRGEPTNLNGRAIMHFLTEFLQLLLRAGGIDRYFYTPKNIFLIQPQAGERLKPMGRVVLNITSLAGLKLLLGSSRIIRDDYCEVYPLLPPDFITLQENLMTINGNQDEPCRRRKERELDTIIRKRALGWLIICFILRKVPQLQDLRSMPLLIDSAIIKTTLDESVRLFDKVLNLGPFKKLFEEARKQTGIEFVELLRIIFVTPYQAENRSQGFRFISWEEIYQRLFIQNNFAAKQINSEQETEVFFRKMLQTMWLMEPHKQYYLERDFASDHPERPQNMVYFLVKMNCSFHKLLRYKNVCQLLLKDKFSEDSTQVVIKIMNIFSKKTQKGQENEEEWILQALKEEKRQEDRSLYNPFVLKSKKQSRLLQQICSKVPQEQGFMGKLARMPEILQSVSSLDFTQSSGKNIVSVSSKQTILTQFCTSLWPL